MNFCYFLTFCMFQMCTFVSVPPPPPQFCGSKYIEDPDPEIGPNLNPDRGPNTDPDSSLFTQLQYRLFLNNKKKLFH